MKQKTEQSQRLLTLRQRAESALKNGELALQKLDDDQAWQDARELIEEFRVYQAELELQNEELSNTQVQVQQALTRYRLLFESLPIASVVLDRYGVIQDANNKAVELFCFSNQSHLLKHSIYRLVSRNDRQRISNALRLDSNNSTTVLEEICIQNHDNEPIVMDVHLIHLPLDYHLDNYTLILLVDRSAEFEREQERALFQSMLDNSPSIMAAFDEQGCCLLANSAMLKFINHSAEQVLGKTRAFWTDETQAKKGEEKDYEVISTGNPALHEEVIHHCNEKHHFISNRFPLRNKDGDIFAVGIVKTDITQKKRIESEIYQLAFYDSLTGTPNRQLLQDRVNQAIALARRENSQLSVLFLDLDRFKEVNDSLGHSAGDELLIDVAARLKSQIRLEDTVCRFGGDEFVLLLKGINEESVKNKAQAILSVVLKPYVIQKEVFILSASIGVALYPRDGEDYETLLKNADAAMYVAKENGRNAFRFFQSHTDGLLLRRIGVENALRGAIENQEFWLAYQPQLCMISKKLKGVEVLLRWENHDLNHPSPDEFIPIAETTGLIVQIGEWVLKESLKQAKSWIDMGLEPFTIAVNISARQLWHGNFSEFVHGALLESQVPATLLELELTERVVMREPEAVIEVMNDLQVSGVQISIDDFGTGYSSLNYLKRLPVTKLKIDQSFVRDLENDHDDGVIVLSIVQLAKALGKETIAEGVETIGQEAFLANVGCDTMQGYLHARPMTAENFEQWFSNHPNRLE